VAQGGPLAPAPATPSVKTGPVAPAGAQGAPLGVPPAGLQGAPQVKHQGLAVPKAGAAAPGAAKPASDCNPSYYYDADGNKHFKPECFLH
jgi:hypothetical protein